MSGPPARLGGVPGRPNAAELPDDFDVVVVHDPQPAALLQILDESSRRKGKWIWRCHIDLSAPYRPVWDFFEPIVNRYDAAIFTAEEYVQPGVQGPVRAFIPPSIDPLSPKNAPMMESTWQGVLTPFGVDPERPLVTRARPVPPARGRRGPFRRGNRPGAGAAPALVGSGRARRGGRGPARDSSSDASAPVTSNTPRRLSVAVACLGSLGGRNGCGIL